jgi:hypothetical protein
MKQAIGLITNMPLHEVSDEMVNTAIEAGVLEDALAGDVKAIKQIEDIGRKETIINSFKEITQAVLKEGAVVSDVFKNMEGGAEGFATRLNEAMSSTDLGGYFDETATQEIGAYFDALI